MTAPRQQTKPTAQTSTARPTQPQPLTALLHTTKAQAQTVPQLPPRTATPTPSTAPAPAQPLSTQPQDPIPPPSPKPERPQVQTALTGRKGLKAKTADQSRPSTPGPETPVTEKPKKKKVTTKKQEETPSVVPPPPPAKVEEGNATPAPEPAQQGEATTGVGIFGDVEKDVVDLSQEGVGAGSLVPVSDVVFPTVGGADVKAGVVTDGSTTDGVSMDNAGTAGVTFDTQVDVPKGDSKDSVRKPSIADRLKGATINNNDLKSPLEKSTASPSSLFGIWKTT